MGRSDEEFQGIDLGDQRRNPPCHLAGGATGGAPEGKSP